MVVFEDHFWGERNAGFDVLYHNMKYGNNASFKLVEFVRERSTVEEVYAKSLLKLAKSATQVSQLGTFEPLWGVLRVATEKLANAHMQVVQKFQELIKELKDYGDKQKEKHKQVKEEFSSTAEIVQTMETMTANLAKSKETYYTRCQELDKSKKDGSSAKEVEKSESKVKKAAEEYKHLVEKREIIRNEFHDRMVEASQKFQKIDEEHLQVIIRYLEQYIESQKMGQGLVEQVYKEFLGQVKALTVHHLLDQFVRSKGTGKVIPDVITFEEYTGQMENAITNNHSPSLNAVKHPSGFPITLKRIEKKKKKKKKKKEEKTENGPVDSPSSEGGDAQSSSFEVDEEGYRIRPPDSESTKSGGNSSSSDSDSDEDEPRKLQVVINPVEAARVPQTASVDEIKKITGNLSLTSPSSMRRNLSSSSGEGLRNRSKSAGSSAGKLSRSSDDLLDIDFSQGSFPSLNSESPSAGSLRNSLQLSSSDAASSMDAELKSQSTTDLRLTSGSLAASSPESIESRDPEMYEVPPMVPSKKGSVVEEPDIPPPLPLKKTANPSTVANDFSLSGVSEVTVDPGIATAPSQSVGSETNSNNLLLMKPPRSGSDIPRCSSVSSALPRPRPQPRLSGTLLVVPGQGTKPVSGTSATTSYSAELFSCLADFTTTRVTTEAADSTTDAQSNENSTTSSSQDKPAVVSFLGSTTTTTGQSLNRATTTSLLGGSQENVPALVRSKTVGGLPSMTSVVHAKAAAGTILSKKDDTLPIAVAFIESVNAFFRGSDQSKCMVKVTGDITVSFPASILPLIYDTENAPLLSFLVRGTSCLEQILPNKALINSKGQLSGGDGVSYDFNMASLADHLKKQSEQGSSTYYNIDIIKYEVKTNGFSTTPLQLCSYWKCDKEATDLRVDYRYNPACMSSPCSIYNVSVLVPVNGEVTIMQSKPSATWSAEHQRALWKLQEVSSSTESQGSLRARFDLSQGPSTPSRIAVQFACNGATISRLNFELKSQEYKLSLVKKRVSTGKYMAES